MSIFGSKKKTVPADAFALMPELEADEPAVNYNTVAEWLVGLSDSDYDKVKQVVDINRKAYADTCKVLEAPNEPSTFITPPAEPEQPEASATDEPAFLDDITPKSKGRKVPVKNAK